MMVILSKYRKWFAVLAIVILSFGIFAPVEAKHHFHGGNIKDIQRRIKHAVAVAKQSEIYQQFVSLRDDYKEMKSVYKNFHAAVDNLRNTIDIRNEDPISSLLTSGKNIQALIDNRYTFQLPETADHLSAENREKAFDRLMDLHQDEFENTVNMANKSADVSDRLMQQAKEMASDQDGAGLAAHQKTAAINVAHVYQKNLLARAKSQALLENIDGDIMNRNYEMRDALGAQANSFNIPYADDEAYQEQLKDTRMTELPK